MRVSPLDIELILVDSQDKADAFKAWSPVSHYVGIDTETTGLQPFGPHADHIRLVQIGDENTGWAIPYGTGQELVASALSRFPGRFVGHNSPFDRGFFTAAGHPLIGPPWVDTFIAHHLLYPLNWHGLKPAAGQLYGPQVRAGEKWLDQVKRKNNWDWATVPIDHPAYWGYAAMDPVLTARLATDMMPQIEAEFRQQYKREVLVSYMMKEMSRQGFPIDVQYAEQLMKKWDIEEKELRTKLEKWAIQNPGSRNQIIAALENDGWEPDVFTDTGRPSVNRAVLEGMDHEVAESILRWRRITKWRTGYALPMVESDGWFHPLINSMKAKTGRMSVEGGVQSAPLQQFPKGPEVRTAVLARPGTEMWAVDYDGQEMRLIAAFAGDPELTDAVLNGGDPHGRIAAELWDGAYTPEQRGWTKNGLYGWAYGAGDTKLGITVHNSAKKFKAAVGRAYPGIPRLMNSVLAKAKERQERDGMAWAKTAGGRIVAVPKTRHYALTDYIMQGSGADLMKEALVRVHESGLDSSLLMIVHDEILASLPPGPEGEEQAHEIARCMTTEFRDVPFTAEPLGPGKNWGEVVH